MYLIVVVVVIVPHNYVHTWRHVVGAYEAERKARVDHWKLRLDAVSDACGQGRPAQASLTQLRVAISVVNDAEAQERVALCANHMVEQRWFGQR